MGKEVMRKEKPHKLRQSALGLIARLRFSSNEFQVFWALLGRLTFDNVSLGSVEELSKDTGLVVSSVRKAINHLETLGVIYQEKKSQGVYFLNPYILWSESEDWEEEQRVEAGRWILERSVQKIEQLQKSKQATRKKHKLVLVHGGG